MSTTRSISFLAGIGCLACWFLAVPASHAERPYEILTYKTEFSEGLAPVKMKSGGYGLINTKGEIVKTFPEALDIMPPKDGMTSILVDQMDDHFLRRIRVYNISNGDSFDINVNNLKDFSGSRAVVSNAIPELYFLIDPSGKRVTNLYPNASNELSEGIWTVQDAEGLSKFIGDDGSVIMTLPKKFSNVGSFSEGFVRAYDYSIEPRPLFLNRKGQVAFSSQSWDFVHPFSEGLARVRSKGKWGSIDIKGETVIPLKWMNIRRFSQGRAGVSSEISGELKWGIVDSEGKMIIEPTWDDFQTFSDCGFALARISDQQVFVNRDGEEVIRINRGVAKSFSNGIAKIVDGGKIYFINSSAEIVLTNQESEQDGSGQPATRSESE